MIPPFGQDDASWFSFRSIEAARLRVVGDARAAREADRRLVARVDWLTSVVQRLLLLGLLVFGARHLGASGLRLWHCSRADDHAIAALVEARAQVRAHHAQTGSYAGATLRPPSLLDPYINPYEVHVGFAGERGFELVAVGRPGGGVAGDAWELDHRRGTPVHLTEQVCPWP